MQIVGVLHERVPGGARNIAHAVRKGIDDVQRRAAQLSGSVVIPRRAFLAVRVHRPVDDPGALLARSVDDAPVEAIVPRHLCLSFRLLDRRRRFLVDNVHNEVGVLPLKVQARRADRSEVRVPARQRIGRGGVGDHGVVLVLEGSFHPIVDDDIKVEISLFPPTGQLPVRRQSASRVSTVSPILIVIEPSSTPRFCDHAD